MAIREVFLRFENNETNRKLTYINTPNYIIMGERKYGPVLMCRMSLKGDAVCFTERMTKCSLFPCTSFQRLWRGLLPLRAHSVEHTWKWMLCVRFVTNSEPCLPDHTNTHARARTHTHTHRETVPVLFWSRDIIKRNARWERRQVVERNVTLLCL
jgi:hypothetical protein